MALFPRTINPQNSTLPKVPGPLMSIGRTGGVQTRSEVRAGRMWKETWAPLKYGNTDVETLISFVENAYNTGATFSITHQLLPGSGKDPNGAGGGTPLINGTAEAGATLTTDGWTISTSGVMKIGDIFKIAGLNQSFRVIANATSDGSGNASIQVNPPVLAGASPSNNAALTLSGNTIRAVVVDYTPPEAAKGTFIGGFAVTFREAP